MDQSSPEGINHDSSVEKSNSEWVTFEAGNDSSNGHLNGHEVRKVVIYVLNLHQISAAGHNFSK